MKTQRLMAFWSYDRFPNVLWGEIESFRSNGTVYVPSYQGCFTPIKILPYEEGMEICQQLTQLTKERLQKERQLFLELNLKLKKIAPFIE